MTGIMQAVASARPIAAAAAPPGFAPLTFNYVLVGGGGGGGARGGGGYLR